MNSTNEYSHENQSATRRKKLTTIIFDTDFFFRPKTRLLIKTHGLEAVTIFQAAICWAAYEDSSATISNQSIEYLSLDLGIEAQQVRYVLDRCCELDILTKDVKGYYSERLAKELNNLSQKQSNYHSAAKNRELAKKSTTEKNKSKIEQDDFQSCPDISSSFLSLKLDNKIEHVRKEQEQEQEKEEDQELEQEKERELKKVQPRLIDSLKLVQSTPEIYEHPKAKAAEEALVPIDQLARDPVFISTGRRPMLKYPQLYLSLPDLCDVIEQYEKAGIPPSELSLGFKPVAARCKDYLVQNKSLTTFNPYVWLIGWALRDASETYKKRLDLERAKSYSSKTAGVK